MMSRISQRTDAIPTPWFQRSPSVFTHSARIGAALRAHREAAAVLRTGHEVVAELADLLLLAVEAWCRCGRGLFGA